MEEIVKLMGFSDFAQMLAVVVAFIGVCAFVTALIVELTKAVERINALPTKLVCYVVALPVTILTFLAMMAWMSLVIEWYMVFAAFLASFVVAKVSMSGWDDVTELYKRMVRR